MKDSGTNGEEELRSVRVYLLDLHYRYTRNLAALDGNGLFRDDRWHNEEAESDGVTSVLRGGGLFEQAVVAFSHIQGQRLPAAALTDRPHLADRRFQAFGVSVIVHPENPYVPTAHCNVRFVRLDHDTEPSSFWFGGGFDLTPYYGFEEDARHWHSVARDLCAPFGDRVYGQYKQACDRYFFLRHRGEARGVGGLFFDDLKEWGFERCFRFVRAIADGFLAGYQPIAARRREIAWGQRQRDFQLYRRGRYVEFNLLWDRGTLFGIQSGARTESILSSLPPLVAWHYGWQPEPGSPEALLREDFLRPRDWLV